MISKEEAKAKLRKAGYSVVDDNSVITVLVSEKTNIKTVVKNVKEIFIKNDYQASFGVRQTNSALQNDENIADEDYEGSVETDDETTDLAFDGEEGDDVVSQTVQSDTAELDVAFENAEKTDAKKAKKSAGSAKAAKSAKGSKVEDEEFFDDEDENPDDMNSSITLDEFDMDMLLNEESVQFSLEDFGMM